MGIQTARGASVVRPSISFIANQMRSNHVGWYRLRGPGLTVALRHRSRDVAILNEVFGGTGGFNGYNPPPELAAELDRLESPRILDLGANIGLFGLYALSRWPASRITAYEPDADSAGLLGATVEANGLRDRWQIHRVACSNRAGTIPFASGLFSDARIAEPGEPGTIEVDVINLFAEDLAVDLLKIDIEGGEWPILLDDRSLATSVCARWSWNGIPVAVRSLASTTPRSALCGRPATSI